MRVVEEEKPVIYFAVWKTPIDAREEADTHAHTRLNLSLNSASQRTACKLLIPASPWATASTPAATAAAASPTTTVTASALPLKRISCALCTLLERLLVGLDKA